MHEWTHFEVEVVCAYMHAGTCYLCSVLVPQHDMLSVGSHGVTSCVRRLKPLGSWGWRLLWLLLLMNAAPNRNSSCVFHLHLQTCAWVHTCLCSHMNSALISLCKK